MFLVLRYGEEFSMSAHLRLPVLRKKIYKIDDCIAFILFHCFIIILLKSVLFVIHGFNVILQVSLFFLIDKYLFCIIGYLINSGIQLY